MNEHNKDKNAYLSRVVYKSRLFDEVLRNVELYDTAQLDSNDLRFECEDLAESISKIVKQFKNNET